MPLKIPLAGFTCTGAKRTRTPRDDIFKKNISEYNCNQITRAQDYVIIALFKPRVLFSVRSGRPRRRDAQISLIEMATAISSRATCDK